jgi:hypothetical protein
MSDKCPTVKVKASHPSQGAFVEINESDFDAAKHERYIELPAAPALPPLPPAPPVPADPLANLPTYWRESDAAALRKLAATISGRAVENKAQAIQVIEAALKARG